MTPTAPADAPLTGSAVHSLAYLGAAGAAGLPTGRVRAADLDVLTARELVAVHFGRVTLSAAGVDLLDSARQPDGAYLIAGFRVGPPRALVGAVAPK